MKREKSSISSNFSKISNDRVEYSALVSENSTIIYGIRGGMEPIVEVDFYFDEIRIYKKPRADFYLRKVKENDKEIVLKVVKKRGGLSGD